MKTWLYMGMYAVLRRSARCSRSVGGVVANILLLRAFGSICCIVSVTVSCMFLPRYSPRCLMCSGVSIPRSRSPAVNAGDVFMQRACDFLMLMFRPLTCWYSLYSCSRGRTSSAFERRRGSGCHRQTGSARRWFPLQCCTLDFCCSGQWRGWGARWPVGRGWTYPVKCLFDIEADKLQWFVISVCFLNEVCGQYGWFLYSPVCHKAVLVWANDCGLDVAESFSQDTRWYFVKDFQHAERSVIRGGTLKTCFNRKYKRRPILLTSLQFPLSLPLHLMTVLLGDVWACIFHFLWLQVQSTRTFQEFFLPWLKILPGRSYLLVNYIQRTRN